MATELQPFDNTNDIESNDHEKTQLIPTKEIAKNTVRVITFDILRGLIMIFMALDHCHGVISTKAGSESYITHDPTYYNTFNGNLILSIYHFLLRLISHTCAPGFFLLMGFGMIYFYKHRINKLKWTHKTTITHLIIRGFILILISQPLRYIQSWYYSGNHKLYFRPKILFALGVNMILITPFIFIEYIINNTQKQTQTHNKPRYKKQQQYNKTQQQPKQQIQQ
eukprot:136298_1